MIGVTSLINRKFVAGAATLFLLSLPMGIQAFQSSSQERTHKVVEANWPDGVLEVKRVNNLQSRSFPTDFQIEVKNISNKPIYSIRMDVIVHRVGQISLGFFLNYGRRELFEFNQPVTDKDVPLLPGESCILTANSQWRQELMPMYKNNDEAYARDTNRVSLAFQRLNFGDGTGYVRRRPFPEKK